MPDATTTRERLDQTLTRRLAILVLAPLLALAILPVAVHIIQKPDLGFTLHDLRVQSVSVPGSILTAGDRIVAIDGRPVTSMAEYFAATAGRYDLEPRRIRIARGDQLVDVVVSPDRPSRSTMVMGLSTWLAGFSFLMIGWWVLSRRHDEVARDFFGLCFIFAFFLADIPDLASVPYQQAKQMVREVLQYLWPAYFLRFFLLFPATRHRTPGRTRRWIFAPAAAFIVVTLVLETVGRGRAAALIPPLHVAAQLYFLGYFVAGLVVFGRKVLRRDRPVLHTKLRVILLGLVAGVIPFLVAMAMGGGLLPQVPSWEYLGFSLILIPVSFALAIMRYGALDTAFVVRTSLVYGLLTVVVVAGYLGTVAVLGTLMSRMYQVSAFPVLVGVIAALSLAVLPLRRRVQTWIDRALYPSRLANRDAMAAVARSLATQVSTDEAHALLLDQLHALYRPHALRLFLAPHAEAEAYDEVMARPDELEPADSIAADDPLLEFLDGLRRPVFVEEFEDWITAPGGQRRPTSARLRHAVLLVPLVTGNRLLGVLLWGAKRDAALYSQDDLANLANLALQVAPMLESLRLYDESLRRRQLETELSVARDIQAQLLPEGPLELGGAHICGRNDPCRHVGGDYYDYFALDDHTLAFCIADVAGKGIPAALMMTTIRVSFRDLAQAKLPPEQVMTELDNRVGAMAATGRFVCFFYGILDVRAGLLTFCNGGHEPPIIFRQDGRREELRRGGTIVGIGAGVPYKRGTVTLERGDLLLGYTDGITEQTSPDGAEFFELERLQAMVAHGRDGEPHEVCGRVFSGVSHFGGDEASDDRTVIVLKFNELPTQTRESTP